MLIAYAHSAPNVMDFYLSTSSDPNYKKILPGKLAEGIALAHENLEPARIDVTIFNIAKEKFRY